VSHGHSETTTAVNCRALSKHRRADPGVHAFSEKAAKRCYRKRRSICAWQPWQKGPTGETKERADYRFRLARSGGAPRGCLRTISTFAAGSASSNSITYSLRSSVKPVIGQRTPFSTIPKFARSRPVTKRPKGSVTVTCTTRFVGACAKTVDAQTAKRKASRRDVLSRLVMALIMSKTSARSKTAVVIADCQNGNTVCRVSRTYSFETGRSVSDMPVIREQTGNDHFFGATTRPTGLRLIESNREPRDDEMVYRNITQSVIGHRFML